MFIGDVYWKGIYLLKYKCFIIAVCMVQCGNICFSGFYSDDLHVQNAARWGRRWPVALKMLKSATWPNLENKVCFFFPKKTYLKKKEVNRNWVHFYLFYLKHSRVVLCNVIKKRFCLWRDEPLEGSFHFCKYIYY